ncbi:hypothetical protein JB92DRAFT_3021756 [Gautieria morchelliformis]|nr:hypothetical protein JB92DRAFT_3021756 [Gautieria morchelliformis]
MRPSFVLLEPLKQWLNVATPPARRIVRQIIKDSPEPLHTQEIFLRSQRDFPLQQPEEAAQTSIHEKLLLRRGPPLPPNPIHHIRSIKYLKSVVLPDLEKRDEIVKVYHTRPPTPEEREIAAALKPPTRSQRKRRGAVGPGKQPTRLNSSGGVNEWVWRVKTQEDHEREAFYRERAAQRKAHAERQRAEARQNRPARRRPLRK